MKVTNELIQNATKELIIQNDLDDVNVILYNTDELYRPYVKTLVSELLCNLRDSFDKTLSVKSETVYTVHLKELLNNEEC